MSSAVLLSTLGAAGTIIGAALGSVIVTVGGALYTQGLARSREHLTQAQSAALRKVRVAQADVRGSGPATRATTRPWTPTSRMPSERLDEAQAGSRHRRRTSRPRPAGASASGCCRGSASR